MRLDKFISTQTEYTRSDIKRLVKSGAVTVDTQVVKTGDVKIDPEKNRVTVMGREIAFKKNIYLMLNKPKGVVSATQDRDLPTVVDLVKDEFSHRELFPAGRLDRDTTGFVLLTDDGDFAHKILSPKNHVPKTYEVTLDSPAPDNAEQAFEKGVVLGDGTECMSAKAAFSTDRLFCEVVIREGMYHQIKRMFASMGCRVIQLNRTKMGDLPLDKSLKEGQWRELSNEELNLIKNAKM